MNFTRIDFDRPEPPDSKLPTPKEEDLSKGILEAVDMESYRAEKKAAMNIALPNSNAEIVPVPVEGGGASGSQNWTA